MKDRNKLEALFHKHGYTDFKWVEPGDVVVSQWVRTKCMFGYGNYGHSDEPLRNMLSATEEGNNYCLTEIQEDLQSAGFTDVQLVRRDEGMHSIVRARVR